MSSPRRPLPQVIRALAAALMLGSGALLGCDDIGRINECNAVIDVINAGSASLKDLHTATDLEARVGELQALDKKLGAVKVERAELRALVEEYRKLLADVVTYARQMEDTTQYSEVERQSSELSKRERELVDRLNGYCRGS